MCTRRFLGALLPDVGLGVPCLPSVVCDCVRACYLWLCGTGAQAAVSLALSALLWQPIANSGMYSMDASGQLSKSSFNNLEVPAMGERKTVPTIEAFFPFGK